VLITALLTRHVEVRLGEERYPIVFTHRVLLDIEAALNVSIVNGEFNIAGMSAKALRTVLFVALSYSGVKYSAQEIGTKLGLRGFSAARQAVFDAWVAAMPEHEPGDSGGKRKTRTWMEVWGNNRQQLGLSDQEWLDMTPRMAQCLDRARMDTVRQNELRLSRIASTVANYGFCRPQQPLADDHFMMHPYPKEEPTDPPTGEYIINQFSKISAQYKKRIGEWIN
jgi:hypothetical protein